MESTIVKPSNYIIINHLGLVIKDLNQTIKFLSSLGIGKFTPINEDMRDGKLLRCHLRTGHMDLEITQPVYGKNFSQEFLDKIGGGIEHVAFVVDDLEKEKAEMIKRGTRVISRAIGIGEIIPRAYMLETDALPGVFIQISKLRTIKREEKNTDTSKKSSTLEIGHIALVVPDLEKAIGFLSITRR